MRLTKLSATRRGMRGALLPFLVLFAVLFGEAHSPALAHGVQEHHGTMAVIGHAAAEIAEERHEQRAPESGQETLQHHHCPVAMAAGMGMGSDLLLARRELLSPGKARVLASYALAPPVEPPLA